MKLYLCARCKQLKEFSFLKSGQRRQYCVVCTKEYWREWYHSNDEIKTRRQEACRRWAEANPDRKKATMEKWAEANPEYNKEQTARWRRDNPERYKANIAAWRAANPEKVKALQAAHVRRYQANKLQREPKWLTAEDRAVTKAFYAVAQLYTRETGNLWSVDHKVPLQGGSVSGLHVPWNLRLMRMVENSKKGNRHEVSA